MFRLALTRALSLARSLAVASPALFAALFAAIIVPPDRRRRVAVFARPWRALQGALAPFGARLVPAGLMR